MTRIQIGWFTDALGNVDDVEDMLLEQRRGDRPAVDAVHEYTGAEEIHHSHGPVCRPVPVYIDLPEDGGNVLRVEAS